MATRALIVSAALIVGVAVGYLLRGTSERTERPLPHVDEVSIAESVALPESPLSVSDAVQALLASIPDASRGGSGTLRGKVLTESGDPLLGVLVEAYLSDVGDDPPQKGVSNT